MRVFGDHSTDSSADEETAESQSEIERSLFRQRIIQIGDIDGEGSTIASRLFMLDRMDHETPIWFWINSPGGDMYDLFCVYDMMQMIRAPVNTICMGIAASAAAVILAAGAKGGRYITPNSYVMIHEIQVESISGTGTELAIEAKESKRMNNRMAEILARHSGQGLAKVKRDCERDYYLDAQGALTYGLVDQITDPTKAIPGLRRRRKSTKPKEKKESPPSRRSSGGGGKTGEKDPPNNPA